MKVLFCGDIMPGGVLPYQCSYIDSAAKEYLDGFDLRIGTLECAIGTNMPPAPEKLKENGGNNNICFARNEDLFRLKEMGFDVVSLGNNHSFDLGLEGLKNTIQLLEKNSIGYFGAGINIEEASRPYLIKKDGNKIGLIGCCIKGLAPHSLVVATENSYGVYQVEIKQLLKQIESLKGKYDYLIIMPHWGEEHIFFPPYLCVQYAKWMIDAGANAVFGSHSHRMSANIYYKGKPIYFGLGNFLYPDNCLTPPRPFYYPKTEDELQHMERCVNYPKSVKRPTVCVWSEDSRVGVGAEANMMNGDINVKRRMFRNGSDNVLRLYKQDAPLKNAVINRILLPLANFLVSPSIYNLSHKIIWKLAKLKLRHLGDFRKDLP